MENCGYVLLMSKENELWKKSFFFFFFLNEQLQTDPNIGVSQFKKTDSNHDTVYYH